MVTALAKMGGLLGLLKLASFFLLWYHRLLFQRQYEASISTEQAHQLNQSESLLGKPRVAFGETFTFERLATFMD